MNNLVNGASRGSALKC